MDIVFTRLAVTRHANVHRLLARQIAAATSDSGLLDADSLIARVCESYEDLDRDRRMTDRSIALMIEENEALTGEIEARALALKLQNDRFVGAIESLSQGLCLYDADNRLVMANRRYAELYGLDPGFVAPGVHLLDVVSNSALRGIYAEEAVVADATAALAEIAAEGHCERVRHLADGSVVHITFNGLKGGGWIALHKDVTSERLAEQRLKENERRVSDFLATSADWCWETDAEHRFIDPASFMGRPATFGALNYIGKRRIDLPVEPDDRPVLERHMAVLAARQPFQNMLYRVPNEDGNTAWIRASGKPIHDGDGVFIGYRGIARDVSREENQKHTLQEALASFRDFAEAASDWFWETDVEHRFKSFSDAFTLVAGANKLVHTGKTRLDFDLHPDDRPAIDAHMADLAARRPFKNLLYRIRGVDVPWLWIRASGKPVFDIAGQFMGYRGSASDVTDDMAKREQLSRQRLFMERAEEVAKLGHWSWNAITGESVWSESVYDILDFAPGERTPDLRRLAAKVHPDDRASFVAAMKDLEIGRIIMDREYRHVRPSDGELRYFQLRVDLEHTPVGEFIGTFGIIQDVTDRKLSELQLQQRTEQLTEAQKLGRTGDWSWRIGDETLWWSPQIFHLLGLDPASFYPTRQAVLKLYVGDGADRVLQSQAIVARKHDVRSVDVKVRRGDGSIGDFAVTSKAFLDRNGKLEGFSGTIQDITERKQAEEQLEQLAYYDPLTGLANRALFRRQIDDVLERTHRSGVSAALLLLDLDRFKEVNDSLGHAAGDELLAKVAHLLGRVIGRDCFLARLGGDEFAVIIPDCTESGLTERIAQDIIAVVSKPVELDRGEVHIGTSIGIVRIPSDGRDSEELLRHADLALYRAKEEGRGRFACFNSDMNDLVQQKTALARDLRHAAAGGFGLETRYQPQVELASNRVVGFETLMRWNHPTRGYISPTEFIPIAESSSLISDIGLWIMRESAVQAKLWLDLGQPPREVSVNVSAAQIWQTELEDDVARILDETGLPPHLLCLELTESLFADHSEGRVRRALTALKGLGVTLALDDFGTGYSSLGYLTQLPFDKLKIDRVFVDGIVTSLRKRKLLEGIIALGRGLGMTVIAEGAEMEAEVDILREFGCDRVQGFVYARPSLASEALAFATDQEAVALFDQSTLLGQLRKIAAQGR